MDCDRVTKLLSEHVDGKLSARLTIEIEQHIEQCHACAALANDLRKTVHVLGNMPRLELLSNFDDALAARLAKVTPATRRHACLTDLVATLRIRRIPILASAGALCATTAIALLTVPPYRAPMPPAPMETMAAQPVAQAVQNQHMALTATDPLEDVAAANLAAYDHVDTD